MNHNGTPSQVPTSIKLYMDTNSNQTIERLTIANDTGTSDQITYNIPNETHIFANGGLTNSGSNHDGLNHNTYYYFKIIKSYGDNNYDSVQNTPFRTQTYNKPTSPSITRY